MNERAIFIEALQIDDPTQREAFLRSASGGDSDLVHRVERLLSADQCAGDFMNFANVQTDTDTYEMEEVGAVIGPYKLREELGDGGMGVVYAAEQEQPVRRKVALKIIKPGMDTREVISRFEVERQALAMMDHQNIARVLDAGATESGRPYFVMELVRGVTMTEYCDKHKLPIRERLKLFVPVCRAIQHAHQKGVIHRDIKPSNVMITLHDGVPVPKVIDFGVAKAINQRLTEATVYTEVSQMLGTPAYMSPEQAELSGLDVDTRSDIYSLGVMLYELLTGNTPFTYEQLADVGFDEMRRIIRETDPPRPSDRISTLQAEASSTIAIQRGDDPRHLTNVLRGELDWIVMKALEKDRTRRYETANGFALDVQRYLDDEPVAACPPSTLYRFRKFARRNKVALAVSLLIGIGLILGVVGLSISNYLIVQERKAKQAALKQAQENEKQADENFIRAQQAVDEYLTRVSEEVLLDTPSLQPLRKDLLELALKYYQEFIEKRGDDPNLQQQTALAYYRVGEINREIGLKQEALQAHRRALKIREELVANKPQDRSIQAEQADSWQKIARVVGELGQNEDAETFYLRACNRYQELVNHSPHSVKLRADYAKACSSVADFLFGFDRVQETEKYLKVAIEFQSALVQAQPDVLEHQSELANSTGLLGSLLTRKTDRMAAGLEYQQKALSIQKRIVDQRPESQKYRYLLSEGYILMAITHKVAGGFETTNRPVEDYDQELGSRAINDLESAISILQPLVRQNPRVTDYQSLLADAYGHLGTVYECLGKLDDMLTACQAASDLHFSMVENEPSVPDYVNQQAGAYWRIASVKHRQGNYEDALADYETSIALSVQLVADHPTEPHYEWTLASTYSYLTGLHATMGDVDRAIKTGQSCRRIRRRQVEQNPGVPKNQKLLAGAAFALGTMFSIDGQFGEALPMFEESREIYEQLYQKQADRYVTDLVDASNSVFRIQRHLGNLEGCSTRERMIDLVEQMPQERQGVRIYLARYADGRWQEVRDAIETVNRNLGQTKPTQNMTEMWWYLTLSLARLGEKETAQFYRAELIRELEERTDLIFATEFINANRAEAAMLLGVDDKQLPASAWEFFGRRMYSDGRWDDARKAFEKCIEMHGEGAPSTANGHHWWFLALTLAQSGEKELARNYYEELCKDLEKKDREQKQEFSEYRAQAAKLLDIELPTKQ